jgi:hypothetical protein
MTKVKCAGCGKELDITSKHAYVQILNHRMHCTTYKWPDSEVKAIGNYLDKVQRKAYG